MNGQKILFYWTFFNWLNCIHLIYFWDENRCKFHLSSMFVRLVNHRPVSIISTMSRWINVGKTLLNLAAFGEETANVRDDHWLVYFVISASFSFGPNLRRFLWRNRGNSKGFKVFILAIIKNFPDLRIQFFLLLNFFLDL